jgi:branched-chain amino acid transport system substrate-binding protein
MIPKKGWLGAIGILVLAVTIACGGSPSSTASGKPSGTPFKIGVILPTSGDFAIYAKPSIDGYRAEALEINEKYGGILGRPVEIVVRDDAGDSTRARAAAQDLVDNVKVQMVFGDFFPAQAVAGLSVTEPKKIVTIEDGSIPGPGDPKKYPYNFLYGIPFDLYPPPMAAAIKKLGGTKVGVLTSTDAEGTAQGDIINAGLPKLGINVVGYQKFDPAAKDIAPQLQRLKSAGVDLIALGTYGPMLGTVMNGVRDLGWKVTVLGDPGTPSGDLLKLIPAEVQSQFYAATYRVQMRQSADAIDAPYRQFLDYLLKQGPVSYFLASIFSADILRLAKWAFEKANSTDGDKVKAALESIRTSKLPADTTLALGNPGWSAATHTANNGDYSQNFALIHTSPVLHGTYLGEPLPVDFSNWKS